LLALSRPFAVLTAVMAVQLVAVEWLYALLGLASEKMMQNHCLSAV
jgi:hypothetical protein